MELSQDIILHHLANHFPVRYVKRSKLDLKLRRPVFFEKSNTIENCSVLIPLDDLKILLEERLSYKDTLYLCTGEPPQSIERIEGSIIVFEEVSFIGIFNYLQELYNLFDQWDERLKTILYDGKSFEDLIDCCDLIAIDPIILADNKFHYVAYSKKLAEERGFNQLNLDENNNMSAEDVNDFIADSTFQSLYEEKEIFGYSFSPSSYSVDEMICKNIMYQDEYMGRIIMVLGERTEQRMNYNKVILEHLFFYADKLYEKHKSFDLKEIVLSSLRGPILDILNKKEIPNDVWEKVTEENKWNKGHGLQLLQFRSNTRYNKNIYIEFLGTEMERKWQGCVSLIYQDRLLLLVNRDRFRENNKRSFHQALAYFLRESLLVAGLSRVFYNVNQLNGAYEQAEIALDYGVALRPTFWYYNFDDFALDYILKTCTGPFEKEQICSGKLLTLKKHDAEKKTEYYKTLFIYFECRLNAAEAARKLFIHRSSFLSRLERIQEITNIDFSSNDELIYIGLSFRILQG